ncbi:MAG: hypothetical protein ABUL47_02760 [Leifsonia sp.]
MKRSVFVIVLAASALLLTGCFPGTGPGSTSAPTGSPSASGPAATPTPTATTAPAAATAGNCTAGPGGDGREIPIVYTVYGPTQGGPVTVSYTAFNTDGSLPVMTATFSGPVWTLIGYACTDAAQSAIWTLTATSITSDAVGCVLDFGGKLVNTNSAFLETSPPAATTAVCSGNPGV